MFTLRAGYELGTRQRRPDCKTKARKAKAGGKTTAEGITGLSLLI